MLFEEKFLRKSSSMNCRLLQLTDFFSNKIMALAKFVKNYQSSDQL